MWLLKFRSESNNNPRFLTLLLGFRERVSRWLKTLSLCFCWPQTMISVLSEFSWRKLFCIHTLICSRQNAEAVCEKVSHSSIADMFPCNQGRSCSEALEEMVKIIWLIIRGWSLSQLSLGERQGASWTGSSPLQHKQSNEQISLLELWRIWVFKAS